MKLKIKKLSLQNWKGQRSYTLNADPEVTNVRATNKAGKSTLADAWQWLWTGKDTKGRADYEVKTRDENGDTIHHLEHTASCDMEVDGLSYTVARIYKEQWAKPTGEENTVLKGHTTSFLWDGIPLTLKKEFDQRTANLFGSVEQFQLLSNPAYFLNMEWQKRRKLLMELAGVTDEGILKTLSAQSKEFNSLITELGNNSLEDFRKKLNADKKTLKSEIDKKPIQIAEAEKAIPEEPDYAEVEAQISLKNRLIDSIEKQMTDAREAFKAEEEKAVAYQRSLYELRMEIAGIKAEVEVQAKEKNREAGAEINSLNNKANAQQLKVQELSDTHAAILRQISQKESQIEAHQRTIARLRQEYKDINTLEMTEGECNCPACLQPLPADKLDLAVQRFNTNKEGRLQDNIKQGKAEKANIEALQQSIEQLSQQKEEVAEKLREANIELANIRQQISEEQSKPQTIITAEQLLASDAYYNELLATLKEKEANAPVLAEADTTELTTQKRTLVAELDALKEQLSVRKVAETQRERIKSLQEELKTLSVALTQLEGKEYVAQQFNRAKIEAIENGINGLFASIKWRMFSPLISGGQEECCEALINGVPYQTANTAAQANAGIECINTLSKHFDMYLPIFIDNAEGIVSLTPSESQIITLSVDGGYKELTVI